MSTKKRCNPNQAMHELKVNPNLPINQHQLGWLIRHMKGL